MAIAGNFIATVHQGLKISWCSYSGGQVPQKAQGDLIALPWFDGLQDIFFGRPMIPPTLATPSGSPFFAVPCKIAYTRQVIPPQIFPIGGNLAEGPAPTLCPALSRQAALHCPHRPITLWCQ